MGTTISINTKSTLYIFNMRYEHRQIHTGNTMIYKLKHHSCGMHLKYTML